MLVHYTDVILNDRVSANFYDNKIDMVMSWLSFQTAINELQYH